MKINTDFIESVKIQDMQTLCIDMADEYLTVTYSGKIDGIKHFIWNVVGITEGGGYLTSYLLTVDEMKERLSDLTRFSNDDIKNVVAEYIKFK